MNYSNYDLCNIVTPVRADVLDEMLTETGYDREKTEFLVKLFKQGFNIGYTGRRDIKQMAPNLKLTVGTKIDLWNKVMKEVKELRYAGPFSEIPFENYLQSPIGLVPKDGGKATRLIFHLSYPKKERNSKRKQGVCENSTSLNGNTPREDCTVQYPAFDTAVRLCLGEGERSKDRKN